MVTRDTIREIQTIVEAWNAQQSGKTSAETLPMAELDDLAQSIITQLRGLMDTLATVQRVYDDAGGAEAVEAAQPGAAPDGSLYTVEWWQLARPMFLSFGKWLQIPIADGAPTPRKFLSKPPIRAAKQQNEESPG